MSARMPTAETLLNPPHYGAARIAIGKVLYWHYRLLQHKRHDRIVLEWIGDSPLVVLPGVLNPKAMRSGKFFASQLQAGLIPQGAEVLDMGTGSGVCAVAAARQARCVAAVDISPVAVRCARLNVLINALEDKIEIKHGDLFAPVKGRRFDVVLFNPPFVRRAPRSDADRAWRSLDVAERFAAGLREHLTPSGSALVLLSTYGDAAEFIRQFRRWNFAMTIVAERTFVNEKLSLLRIGQIARGPEIGTTQ